MVLNKKIARTCMEHKSRYIGIVILIMISCMLFTAFNQAVPWVLKNIKDFKRNNKVEDAQFITVMPLDNIKQLESKFNIQLEERKTVDYNYNKSTILRLLQETKKLDKYVATKGNSLKNSKDILIDEEFAKAHKLDIGDNIKIYNKTFDIAGFTSTPDYLYVAKSESDVLNNHNTFGIGVVSKDSIKDIKGITFYSIKFNKNNQSAFKSYINETNTITNWLNNKDNMRINFPESDMNTAGKVGNILATTILLLTCLFAAMILWRILKEEFVQMGTLFALGYRKSELLKHYLTYCLILVPTGSILGTIAGLFFEKGLVYIYKFRYNLPVLQITYDYKVIAVSIILPFIFIIPAAAFTVLKALKMPPLVLMRGGSQKTKIGFLERKLKLNKLSFKTKFVIRELLRNIPRAVLMILGTAFASMLLLMYFVSTDSMDVLLSSYTDIYHYKYDYTYRTFQTSKPAIGEPQNLSTFTVGKSKGFVMYGITEESKLLTLKDSNGRKLKYNQLILSEPLAKKLGVKAGDYINLKNTPTGRKARLRVGNLTNLYLGNLAFLPIDKFNKICGYPKGSYLKVVSRQKLHISKEKLSNSTASKDVIDGFSIMLKALKMTLLAMAIMAFIIGLVVIYVITSMLIEESKSNISLLKILGYPQKQIFSMILSSNTVLVVIGYILAVPLIVKAFGMLFANITKNLDFSVPAHLNYPGIIICFILIMMTYQFSNFLSRRKINRISMADSLKSRAE